MIYLFVVSIIWAFSFGLIKDNLAGVDPNFVSFIRLSLSFLVFLPFLQIKNLPKRTILRLLMIGMVQYGMMYITYIFSFRFLQAYEVALFTILTPLYVTLLSQVKTRSHFKVNLFTTGLAILGAAVIEKFQLSHSKAIPGFILLQISNLCFAYGQIEYKHTMDKLPEIKDRQVFGILYLGAVILTALSTLLFADIPAIRLTGTQILSLVYLGLVASGFGFFLWNYGARRTNPGALAIFNNLKIPFGVAASLVFFHESTSLPALIIGGVLMVAALVINEWALRQPAKRLNENISPHSKPRRHDILE